jgi:hypothetical protein
VVSPRPEKRCTPDNPSRHCATHHAKAAVFGMSARQQGCQLFIFANIDHPSNRVVCSVPHGFVHNSQWIRGKFFSVCEVIPKYDG